MTSVTWPTRLANGDLDFDGIVRLHTELGDALEHDPTIQKHKNINDLMVDQMDKNMDLALEQQKTTNRTCIALEKIASHLEILVNHILYSPDNPGAEQAKKHWEDSR